MGDYLDYFNSCGKMHLDSGVGILDFLKGAEHYPVSTAFCFLIFVVIQLDASSSCCLAVPVS